MPIMNYTTKIESHKSHGEIQMTLAKHGAKKIMTDYDDDGRIAAIAFLIDTPTGLKAIRLPAKVDAVHQTLIKQKVKCDREQAERVAWRILKDWIDAQMAILESEMVSMDEVFLPYMLDTSGKQTLYDAYKSNQLLLAGGEPE